MLLHDSPPVLRQRILIADDDRKTHEVLRHCLEPKGYAVTSAFDGIQALEHIRTDQPAVVFLAVSIPCKDGIQVLRELRSAGNSVGVITLTGTAEESAGREALASGAFDNILKPIDPVLVGTVLWWSLQLAD